MCTLHSLRERALGKVLYFLSPIQDKNVHKFSFTHLNEGTWNQRKCVVERGLPCLDRVKLSRTMRNNSVGRKKKSFEKLFGFRNPLRSSRSPLVSMQGCNLFFHESVRYICKLTSKFYVLSNYDNAWRRSSSPFLISVENLLEMLSSAVLSGTCIPLASRKPRNWNTTPSVCYRGKNIPEIMTASRKCSRTF